MLFDEGDATLLKSWIVKRLEDISDAESDVLADYVLALLRHEQGEEDVKQLCMEQLDDFLREHTGTFVEDVFTALRTKAFLSVNSTLTGATLHVSSPPLPPPAQESAIISSTHEPHQGLPLSSTQAPITSPIDPQHNQYSPTANTGYQGRDNGDRAGGKKRSYFDRDREGGRGDSQFGSGPNGGGNRGFKAPRRGNERGGRWGARGDSHGGPGRGGFLHGGNQPPGTASLPFQAAPIAGLPPPPVPPPGFPWAEDPMAAFLAVQAAAGWAGMPGFPPIPPPVAAPPPPTASKPKKPVEKKTGERCKDYDEKGYCMQGDMCPYEHGLDHIVIPGQDAPAVDEYDPNNAQIFPISKSDAGTPTPSERGGPMHRGSDRGRGRGQRGHTRGGRGGRSELSHTGPNFDKSNTTLVIEHIPDDKLSEASIKEFFGEFGTVSEVQVQAYKHLATVKFERWDMAKRAYDSPAPIFDNRFVKVFWQRSGQHQAPAAFAAAASTAAPSRGGRAGSPNGRAASPVPQLSKFTDESEEIDMEEFTRKQEEAQKAHEAKLAKKKAHEEAMKELERKKEELLRKEMEQKQLLMEKLAKRRAAATGNNTATTTTTSSPQSTSVATPTPAGTPPNQPVNGAFSATTATTSATAKEDPATEALRAQLEALEAEAKSLGIAGEGTDEFSSGYRGRGRGRGGVFRGASRGRGGYNPYYAPYVPGYRGRGGAPPFAARGRGGAMRLDNRTKKVAVKGVERSGEKDEALRQYLLGIGEFESIEPHADKDDMQVITFKDRLTAEKFIQTGKTIPNIGIVELSWVQTPLPPVSLLPSTTAVINPSTSGTPAGDITGMGVSERSENHQSHSNSHNAGHHQQSRTMEEYDLADDDEGRWLAS